MNKSAELRRFQRVMVSHPVKMTVDGEQFDAVCTDISATGVKLTSKVQLMPNKKITVELSEMPPPYPEMVIEGGVLRCDEVSQDNFSIAVLAK